MEKIIDLAGTWNFSFEKPVYDDTITLPGTTAMAGKGAENTKEETGYLTERYPYEGRAYFSRKITLPRECVGKNIFLFLERTRMTRIRVNGVPAGAGSSLTTPHRFDITQYVQTEKIELEIEVANTGYPTIGGHMTSPDTQTNWLGIMGRMELQICGKVSVQSVHTTCDVQNKTMTLDCEILNTASQALCCTMHVQPEALHLSGLITPEGKNYEAAPETKEIIRVPMQEQTVQIRTEPGKHTVTFVYHFDKAAILWSEHTPVVYQMHISLGKEDAGTFGSHMDGIDRTDVFAALRSFTADAHDFYINGVPVKLRGKHDGLLFPLTGAAPMDLKSWLRVMGRSWQYGINHYRYHTCCPPEAAFLAADLLGIYMEPELPFWGTIAAEGEEGYQEEEQEYLIQEGRRMLREYGNHPSYCMMSLGNELWGSKARVNEIIGILKAADDRPLYTQGSNNFQFIPEILSNEDFLVAARLAPPVNGENKRLIRGSFGMCDAPLGPVQVREPGTSFDFDAAIMPELASPMDAGTELSEEVEHNFAELSSMETEIGTENMTDADGEKEIAIQYGTGVKLVKAAEQDNGVTATVPIVGHEIGQYSMFPNFKEIPKYTGVLDARNLKVFERRITEAGMADRSDEFFRCAGKFAVECYREELEMMHRSRYMAGYQILDIQDYTGQGTSLVGILDAFMESKGLVEPEIWRGYSSDEVLLACFDKYVYTEKESFTAEIRMSFFNPMRSLKGKRVEWKLLAGEKELHEGMLPISRPMQGTFSVGVIKFEMPTCEEVNHSKKLTFVLNIPETPIHREYTLWIYPKAGRKEQSDTRMLTPGAKEVFVTTDGKEAWKLLENGAAVLFFPEEVNENIPGFYCTDFWNYTMFRQISESMGREVAVGTLGLCIQKDHPALAEFACEAYSTPQWFSVVSASKCAILDKRMPASYKPIVQMIDNIERNHKLGILFEASAGKDGKLLICTADLQKLLETPEGRQLVTSIRHYAASSAFAPEIQMQKKDFEALFVLMK
jgi:hypothetical protein